MTKLDPLQFAYKQHTGVNDAVLYMLHRALAHLEETGAYVRIMFTEMGVDVTVVSAVGRASFNYFIYI